jgi:hypothetical protein
MPVQFKQVISSFLTQSAYKKLAVSATWRILPGSEVLMLSIIRLLFFYLFLGWPEDDQIWSKHVVVIMR